MMDYGKFKYEQSVRQREARKKQSRTVVKEVKFRPQTDQHDYEWKKRRVIEFLEEGDKVKITVMFRGREVTHPEIGQRMMARLAEDVAEYASVEQVGRLEGRNMSMSLAPTKRRHQERQKAQVHEDEADAVEEAVTETVVAEESVIEDAATEAIVAEDGAGETTEAPDAAESVAEAVAKKVEENEEAEQGDADTGTVDGE